MFAGESGATVGLAGNDILVNTYTTGAQSAADVVRHSDGSFIVVWGSQGQDGSGWGVFGRKYDRDGIALGGEFQVNSYTTGDQYYPAIASDGGSGFVVQWSGGGPQSGVRLYARLFDAPAQPAGPEFAVGNAGGLIGQSHDVSVDGSGGFVSVWAGSEIAAQRFDAAGSAIATQFQVNTYTTDAQFGPRVARSSSGDFLIIWRHITPGGSASNQNVRARAFAADGTPIGPDFDVIGHEAGRRPSPAVSALDTGEFAVVWVRGREVQGRIFDTAGQAVTSPFAINTVTVDYVAASGTAVSGVSGGDFVVAWAGPSASPNDGRTIAARRMSRSGAGVGPQVVARNVVSTRTPNLGGIAANTAGSFVVAWHDTDYSYYLHQYSIDGSDSGVLFSRYCDAADSACDLCAGFDDSVDVDGDSVADGCDICVNVASAANVLRSTVKLRRVARSRCAGNCRGNRVKAMLQFEVAQPVTAIAPESTGIRLLIEAASGGDIFDVALPPGAYGGSGTRGWSSRRAGKWQYLDTTEERINGTSKVTLTAKAKRTGTTKVRVKLDSILGLYSIRKEMLPLAAHVRIDGMESGPGLLCGEKLFDLRRCRFSYSPRNVFDTTMKCR